MNSAEYLINLIGKIFIWLIVIPIGIIIAVLNEGSPAVCTAVEGSFLKPGTPVPYWIAKPVDAKVVCVAKER